jgi:hypothetical protein
LVNGSAKTGADPAGARALYAEAWQEGVSIAAFKQGHLYEYSVSTIRRRHRHCLQSIPARSVGLVPEGREGRRTECVGAFRQARGGRSARGRRRVAAECLIIASLFILCRGC